MSFGKTVIEVALALKREGSLPPTLPTGARNKRILDELQKRGHKPGEMPSPRTIARHLDRLDYLLEAADTTRRDCRDCHVHDDAADGMLASSDFEEDQMQAQPQALQEITQAVRQYLLIVPASDTIDEAICPLYLTRLVNSNLKPGDSIELRAVDMAWIARLLIVSVVRSTGTIATKLVQAPTFLLSHADRSPVHIIEQINELEQQHRTGKVLAPEYEARMRTLHALRDHQRYPTQWLRGKLAELDRAHDAGLLTRWQHDKAVGEIFAVMDEAQKQEMGGVAKPDLVPAADGGDNKRKPAA